MSGTKIERYFGRDCLCPAIVAVGRSDRDRARESFPPHAHRVFEICFITKGAVDWWIADKKFHLASNSVFVTQPGERHGTIRGILEPCVLNWIQIDQRQLGGNPLRRQLSSLPVQTRNCADKLLPYLDQILAECRRPRRDSRQMIEASLQMLLALLLRHAKSSPLAARPGGRFPAIQKFVLASAETDLTVLDICNHFDLSRSYLHQLFVRHLSIGPQAYLMERRLKRAARLLADGGKSITEIAHQLHFSSSQHFATAFKNHYGMNPRKWASAHS
jgi:AraC-like DNA-binding protein